MSVDDLLQHKARQKPGILDQLEAAARSRPERVADDELEPPEKLSPLPRPGDPYTLAFASSRHHTVPTIRFLLGNANRRGFPIANLDSVDWVVGEKPGDAPMIVLRFDGLTATEVWLEGRHMETLYDLLGQFKVSWVRELPTERDYRDEGEPVINRVRFVPFEPVKR